MLGIADGEVRVYGLLGRGESDLLVVDTSQPPKAKLVTQKASAPIETTEDSNPHEAAGHEQDGTAVQ